MTHDLCERAIYNCFDRKWSRRDVLCFIEKYSGIDRSVLYADELAGNLNARNHAAADIAYYLEELVDEILNGEDLEDIEPVSVRQRRDGMTGKVRDIACLCIQHQLLGHLAKLAIDPLLKARLLPTQHASIPGRGQTYLKEQAAKYFRKNRLEITVYQKTDVHHAYQSTMYAVLCDILRREIPSAKQVIRLVEYLGSIAPGNHLIIGGYFDAWAFNLVMSYAIRHTLEGATVRRGKSLKNIVRIESYMDDFALLGRTKTGVKKGARRLQRFLSEQFHMELRFTTGIISLSSIEEERAARHNGRPSKRGSPSLDMGGYQIHRTYITMRPRVHKRVRRTFMRAYEEIKRTGTIQRQRAKTLSARYGFIVQTDASYFIDTYHVAEVMNTARAVNSYWSRRQAHNKKEWLYNAVHKDKFYERAFSCRDREAS